MSETPTFDPFELVKNVQNNDPDPIEGIDIMMDRQGYLDQQREIDESAGEFTAYEAPVADITPEDRRGYAAQIVANSFTTDNVDDLMSALHGVEAWLKGDEPSAPPQAGEAAPGEPFTLSPDDDPTQG